ncbi:MAG: YfiR family protein [Candidatus Riflebacteria bacterium]|nr:YfiR family protein [Candidatus Riflebacteria bacterium]
MTRFILGFILAVFINMQLPCLANEDLEAKIKAAYIYHFNQFIDWKFESENDKQSPLKVCVIGKDPIGNLLNELSTTKVEGRPLHVEYNKKEPDEMPDCHILFISKSLEKQLSQILSKVQGKNILTVSDISDFAKRGGKIGFVKDSGKIKIEINLGNVKNDKYKINAKLLEVARIIK